MGVGVHLARMHRLSRQWQIMHLTGRWLYKNSQDAVLCCKGVQEQIGFALARCL